MKTIHLITLALLASHCPILPVEARMAACGTNYCFSEGRHVTVLCVPDIDNQGNGTPAAEADGEKCTMTLQQSLCNRLGFHNESIIQDGTLPPWNQPPARSADEAIKNAFFVHELEHLHDNVLKTCPNCMSEDKAYEISINYLNGYIQLACGGNPYLDSTCSQIAEEMEGEKYMQRFNRCLCLNHDPDLWDATTMRIYLPGTCNRCKEKAAMGGEIPPYAQRVSDNYCTKKEQPTLRATSLRFSNSSGGQVCQASVIAPGLAVTSAVCSQAIAESGLHATQGSSVVGISGVSSHENFEAQSDVSNIGVVTLLNSLEVAPLVQMSFPVGTEVFSESNESLSLISADEAREAGLPVGSGKLFAKSESGECVNFEGSALYDGGGNLMGIQGASLLDCKYRAFVDLSYYLDWIDSHKN